MPNWDDVYREKEIVDATAVDVLTENMHILPMKGKALDFASGLAGNAFFLAANGFEVEAWDMSGVAVEKINQYARNKQLNVSAKLIDLETSPPDIEGAFDVIVVSYFLHRETLQNLYRYLKKDGLLFYQTFSGKQIDGRGPSRENFRLKSGELLDVYSNMELLFYREDPYIPERQCNKPDQVLFVAKK